jgi:two-component system, OmpR family, response regulator
MPDRTHILIVDDDRGIRTLLRDYLVANGFHATAAGGGQEARAALARERVDLIVLDLMLPNEHGLDICRELRTRSSIPIIMLTALGEEDERIQGLEAGADDYLPKPFSPRELVVRIRTVLRRTTAAERVPSDAHARAYRFADWRLDIVTRTLRGPNDAEVALSGADFRLLTALLARAPHVVSRAALMALLRGREHDPFDRSIDVRISRLRQALGDDARAPHIIKTVYGEGYVIGAPVDKDVAP